MKFIVQKSKTIKGTIRVSGAKNAALKMIAASILIKGTVELNNAPDILDVVRMIDILKKLGGKVTRQNHKLTINTKTVDSTILPKKLVGSLRGSVTFLGALLSRFGKATLPFPGGCNIGRRPIDYHIDIFKQLGVDAHYQNNIYYFKTTKEPSGNVHLMGKSVTATENAILYLVLNNNNITTITNCAAEPEIDDLIAFLNKAGAKIVRKNASTITISGVKSLNKCTYSIMGDRIEAGTWMVLGLLLGHNLKILGLETKYLETPIKIAKNMGGNLQIQPNSITANRSVLQAVDITTGVYPEFPTDLQSPFGLLLTQAKGKSLLNETVFNDRLKYLHELKTMGAKINIINKHIAKISGPTVLRGKHIKSTDLRAGATFILAGLIAQGKTIVEKAQIIDRGYEKVDDKLRKVGANITRS